MKIHSDFRLNGIPLDKEGLYEVAYSWVKEGKDFELQAGDFLLDWLSTSNIIQVKTSGSTGVPKIIELQKDHMVNSALATGSYFQLEPENTALLCLSTEYIAGKMMLVRAMVLGLWITVVEPSSNPLEFDARQYDFAAMVPLQVQNSFAKLHQINTLIVGGAPISTALRTHLKSLHNSIFETYGMTETITHIAVKEVVSDNYFFQTLPGVNIRTDDRSCLIIEAPKVSKEVVVTNDLVEISDKNRFKWLGRYDNIINSGGIKLIPELIEEKLSPIMTNRFFVAGLTDEQLGQKLVLFIEGKVDLETIQLQIEQLKDLDKYEYPKAIFMIPNFIETRSGKVNRNATLSLIKKR